MTTKTTESSSPAPSERSDPHQAPGLAELSEAHQIFNHTYLSGVFFLVNAVPDVRLLFDGPSCGYDKAFLVAGTHDLFSRMFRFPAKHRITCTHVQADTVVHDREETLRNTLVEVAGSSDVGLILVTAMPMASITGIDYQGILNRAAPLTKAPVALVPDRSFRNDWLAGYDDALCTLADELVEPQRTVQSREDVAVVGYFLDRNEGDHRGNLAELHRVMAALGLKLESTWLDGSPTSALRRVAEAGTIVSLPYGRRAARRIADRTGAALVELDLPLGVAASKTWILELGAATGRRWEARQLIDAELRDVVPILDVTLTEYLQGRRFAVNGDPFLGQALVAAFQELGCTPAHAVVFGVKDAVDRLQDRRALDGVEPLYAARMSDVMALDLDEVDFIVGNSYVHYLVRLGDPRKPYVELGYPSYRHHELSHRPNLFFKGFVNLVNRVINAL